MFKTKYFIGCLIIASLYLSCSKSDSYDIKGDPEVKFFLNNNPSFGNAPDNSISYNVTNIPDASGSGLLNLSSTIPAAVKFPVFASSPVSDDVTIGADLDNSLIAAYNTSHNTNYIAFPTGLFNTSGLIAHIAKGTTTSADSITITSDATKLSALTGQAYMAPLKLTTVSNNLGVITSTTMITYIVVNVELRRIKYLATTADALGALVTNRTAWTATFTPAPTTTGSIFDGSATTFSRWVASPVQLDVNMQTTQNVTGMRLYTATSTTYVPTQVDVYLSNDGINYDKIGSVLKANMTYSTTYNYILFYKAIPAKYIRLVLSYVTSTNTQNYRIVEFDVYAN